LSSLGATPGSGQQRFRQQIHEGAKFGIVGLTGLIVVLAGSDLMHFELGLGKFTSVTIATVLATVVTFLGNRHWSFRDREGAGTRYESVMFFLLNGVGLLIQYAVLGFTNYVLGLDSKLENVIALNIGIGLGTLFRFWSYRKWVWVPEHVHLARLQRGRHRKNREAGSGTSTTAPAANGSAIAPAPNGSTPLPTPRVAAGAAGPPPGERDRLG
jgi:putative flippase GtrA